MASTKKIEELRQALAEQADDSPYAFIITKDGKRYLSDGFKIGRELTPDDEARIRRVKVCVDDEDLTA